MIVDYKSNLITRPNKAVVKGVRLKANGGRWGKRCEWVICLHGELLVEFLWLRAMNIKILRSVTMDASMHILAQSTCEYNTTTIESGRLISSRIIQVGSNPSVSETTSSHG